MANFNQENIPEVWEMSKNLFSRNVKCENCGDKKVVVEVVNYKCFKCGYKGVIPTRLRDGFRHRRDSFPELCDVHSGSFASEQKPLHSRFAEWDKCHEFGRKKPKRGNRKPKKNKKGKKENKKPIFLGHTWKGKND